MVPASGNPVRWCRATEITDAIADLVFGIWSTRGGTTAPPFPCYNSLSSHPHLNRWPKHTPFSPRATTTTIAPNCSPSTPPLRRQRRMPLDCGSAWRMRIAPPILVSASTLRWASPTFPSDDPHGAGWPPAPPIDYNSPNRHRPPWSTPQPLTAWICCSQNAVEKFLTVASPPVALARVRPGSVNLSMAKAPQLATFALATSVLLVTPLQALVRVWLSPAFVALVRKWFAILILSLSVPTYSMLPIAALQHWIGGGSDIRSWHVRDGQLYGSRPAVGAPPCPPRYKNH